MTEREINEQLSPLWNEFTAKIFLFYIVLYAFLAAFFAAMLLVFFQTLDLYQPRWQNSNGLIGTNPGE